ncbi:MAG: SpoIVB peptidase [Clostridia bacterium]|nr:SpoIVB peptidase [Clostridia bacterium]
MKKLIKITDVFLSVLCVIVFVFITLGTIYHPEKFVFYDNVESYNYMTVFNVTKSESTIPVFKGRTDGETSADISLFGIIPVTQVEAIETDRKYVNIGGNLVGIKIYTDGLLVVDVQDVDTINGLISPGQVCGIRKGDIITHINDEIVKSVSDFSQKVSLSEGENVSITVKRENNTFYFSLKPCYSESEGKYRCGLWLKDSTAGIGTLTFTDPVSGKFASLGHAIYDSDTKSVLTVSEGDIMKASLNGCQKGDKGQTGQIKGVFSSVDFGDILENNEFGVYGIYDESETDNNSMFPVASQSEIKTGEAQIISTVSEEGPEVYDIEIEKINYSSEKQSRSMVIKVTDEDLIEQTGGIIQGMSGSPIIQNGMFVGAVTHVFLNDPERGYGIFAETMIDTMNEIE